MRFWIKTAALGTLLTAPCLQAQEGFPLDGTWRGTFGPEAGDRTTVVMVMKWDGENINGTINPGPNSFPFASAVLEPSDWTVHIEARSRDGEPIVIDGKLENIGSYNRTLTGTWSQAGVDYSLKIARE
jgi:hypothetical protein